MPSPAADQPVVGRKSRLTRSIIFQCPWPIWPICVKKTFNSRSMDSTCHDSPAKTAFTEYSAPLPGWKRAIDIGCCLAALPVLALCTLVMTIIIRLTSPGPVLFRQQRVGYLGRRFVCYKFRTMKVSADTSVHQAYLAELMRSGKPMVKMDSRRDSRLIPGAWILRASGLDELPQIINVLRGEMSLVGPRPCLPYEYDGYLPWQRDRFRAAPGLTGLWQVSGKNRTTFDEMIQLDIRYAQEKSMWLDLKIMFLTLPALLTQISDTRRGRSEPPAEASPSLTSSAMGTPAMAGTAIAATAPRSSS
jgi:exopolysaccharide production protein ExoY